MKIFYNGKLIEDTNKKSDIQPRKRNGQYKRYGFFKRIYVYLIVNPLKRLWYNKVKPFLIWLFKAVAMITASVAIVMAAGYWLATPNSDALVFREIVWAQEIDRVPPILKKIAICESGDRHFNKDGSVITGRIDKDDTGRYQINLRYHGKNADRLGLNLFDEVDNQKYALWLLENKGTSDWGASQDCWKKL